LCSPGKSIDSLNKGLEILGSLLRKLDIDIPKKLNYKNKRDLGNLLAKLLMIFNHPLQFC
jgi:hypothetical protein